MVAMLGISKIFVNSVNRYEDRNGESSSAHSSWNFASYGTNHQDLHERRSRQKTDFWADHPNLREDGHKVTSTHISYAFKLLSLFILIKQTYLESKQWHRYEMCIEATLMYAYIWFVSNCFVVTYQKILSVTLFKNDHRIYNANYELFVRYSDLRSWFSPDIVCALRYLHFVTIRIPNNVCLLRPEIISRTLVVY